jgi:hypothetical protein
LPFLILDGMEHTLHALVVGAGSASGRQS